MNNRGIALPLVLWGIAFLSGIVILVAVRMSQRIDEESRSERMFRARQMALRGLAIASSPQVNKWDPILKSGSPEDEGYSVRITDESGRINPNFLLQNDGRDAFLDIFVAWGAPLRVAEAAFDALTDWTDEDNLRSLAGAEAPEYTAAGSPGLPPNATLTDLSELEYVMTLRDLLAERAGWRDMFTVRYNGKVNVNHASPDVLSTLGGLEPEHIARLNDYLAGLDGARDTKDDQEFEDIETAMGVAGATGPQAEALERWFGVSGGMRRIESTGYSGGIERTISAVVGEDGTGIFAWEER